MPPEEYSGPDRRRHPRAIAYVPLKISQETGDIVTETVNISRSGAYCRVNQHVHLMTKLRIQILLPASKDDKSNTRTIQCQGVVVRVEPSTESGHFNIAIFFSEISKRDAEAISDYVNSCLEKDQ